MTTASVNFVVPESLKSVALGAGIPVGGGHNLDACPVQVGDVVSFPQAPAIFFKVVGRMLQPGHGQSPAQWLVLLDQTTDPLTALDARQP